jgi:hypothetical protein
MLDGDTDPNADNYSGHNSNSYPTDHHPDTAAGYT